MKFMAKLRTIALVGLIGGGIYMGGSEAFQQVNNPDTPPDAEVSHYEGLPFPKGGEAISHATKTKLIVDLSGNGAVNFSANVRNKEVMNGTAHCVDDKLSVQAGVAVQTKYFHGTRSEQKNVDGAGICDGDRVSVTALQPSGLPRYILSLVAGPDLSRFLG